MKPTQKKRVEVSGRHFHWAVAVTANCLSYCRSMQTQIVQPVNGRYMGQRRQLHSGVAWNEEATEGCSPRCLWSVCCQGCMASGMAQNRSLFFTGYWVQNNQCSPTSRFHILLLPGTDLS